MLTTYQFMKMSSKYRIGLLQQNHSYTTEGIRLKKENNVKALQNTAWIKASFGQETELLS